MGRSSRHPREVRERAVALVFEQVGAYSSQWEAITSIAAKVGVSAESLRRWVRQAETDGGARPGVTTAESERVRELERENRELRRANEILKAASGFLREGARPSTAALVAFITEYRDLFGVEPICAVLTEFGIKIAPSTYYAALSRPASAREVRDEELKEEIGRVYDVNYRVYGARKVWRQLNREGIRVGRGRVERLMRVMGLAGAVRGKTVRTTVSDPGGVRAADLVKRQFTAGAPNRLWVADFTYVATWAGTVYVAFAIDVFSRRIVGWRASTSKETGLVLDAIERGLRHRNYRWSEGQDKLIHHSDAGSQYTPFRFTQHLIDSGIDASIGTVGDALDNALAESTIGLYKTELIKPNGPWHNKQEVDVATAAWIEWYNTQRLHGACGDRPPVEFETLYEDGDLISLVA
ncbi:IS3 family transposase [Amycolatopsis speibonae]|uniref:IS3 family transposase n=1 Tax=Amycolatopsis speibonae TaxID=1450224 RepID=A0ABV7NRM2_9PSEU